MKKFRPVVGRSIRSGYGFAEVADVKGMRHFGSGLKLATKWRFLGGRLYRDHCLAAIFPDFFFATRLPLQTFVRCDTQGNLAIGHCVRMQGGVHHQ